MLAVPKAPPAQLPPARVRTRALEARASALWDIWDIRDICPAMSHLSRLSPPNCNGSYFLATGGADGATACSMS